MDKSEETRILVADDEETFLYSTAALLRREGYQCDCAPNGVIAAEMLRGTDYDLLVADLEMPGNANLELIRNMPQINEGLPIILVTAYPTLNSAIQSIQLPVVAYLIKPVEHDELLLQVRSSIKNFRVRSVITRRRDHLQNWRKNLAVVDQVDNGARTTATAMPITAFVDLTFQNITGALFDLKHLTETLTTNRSPRETCHLFNCPRLSILTDALMETIAVLEKTKSSFKSKELGELRKKLEKLVKNGHSQPVHDASTA